LLSIRPCLRSLLIADTGAAYNQPPDCAVIRFTSHAHVSSRLVSHFLERLPYLAVVWRRHAAQGRWSSPCCRFPSDRRCGISTRSFIFRVSKPAADWRRGNSVRPNADQDICSHVRQPTWGAARPGRRQPLMQRSTSPCETQKAPAGPGQSPAGRSSVISRTMSAAFSRTSVSSSAVRSSMSSPCGPRS
jgi:hypothetical protein